MRGKLRDKRPDVKRDSFKRESERRRTNNKRDNRSLAWLNQQIAQAEEDYLLDEDEELLLENTKK